MKKNKEDTLQTRELLIDAALEIFYQKGVARTTLDQIAKAAGLTRGAIYWHFKNKADVFEAVCQRFFSIIDDLVQLVSSYDASDFWRGFEESISAFYSNVLEDEFLQKFCSVVHLRCEYTDDNREIVNLLNQYRDIWVNQIDQLITLGINGGHLDKNTSFMEMNFFIRSNLLGLTVTWLEDPIKVDLMAQAKINIRIMVEFLQEKNYLFIP